MKVRSIRKIILTAAVCSVFLTACGSETSSEKASGAGSVFDRIEAPTEVTAAENTTAEATADEETIGEQTAPTEVTAEDFDIKVPENAVYRQTELEYIEGKLSTICFRFFNEHDNCIYLFSQPTEDSNDEWATTFDCSYSYKYNDDGTIAESNSVSSLDDIQSHCQIEYRNDKTVLNKTFCYQHNGKPWYTSVSTYDEHSNPLRTEMNYVNSNRGYISTYEYEYDSDGRILVEKNFKKDLLIYTKRYTYDDNGNTASIDATYAGSDFPQLTKYTYNSENRLIKEEYFVFGEEASYTEYTEYEYEFYN